VSVYHSAVLTNKTETNKQAGSSVKESTQLLSACRLPMTIYRIQDRDTRRALDAEAGTLIDERQAPSASIITCRAVGMELGECWVMGA
jgi:hypothetical protein